MGDKLKIDEMARELRISTRTFRRYLSEYKIPFYQVGRTKLFKPAEVEACLRTTVEKTPDPKNVVAFPKKRARIQNRLADRLGI